MGPIKVYTTEEIRNLENRVVSQSGISEELLMEGAAYSALDLIKEHYKGYSVVVVCGTGNNGGDGYALARLLHSKNFPIEILTLHKPPSKGSALTNYQRTEHIDRTSWEDLKLDSKTLVIDAIFGTGLNRPLDRETIEFIHFINSSNCQVLSLDIPSGVNGDTGEIMGAAVKADMTLSFIGYKRGHLLFPGSDYCGNLKNSNISIPPHYFEDGTVSINTPVEYPKLNRNRNKFTGGRVLTIAGSNNFTGAAYLSSTACLYTSCGYSTLLSENSVLGRCSILTPELILKGDNELSSSLKAADVITIGPGLGRGERAENLIETTLREFSGPLILDADALFILSMKPELFESHSGERVLTPHTGELARLMNTTSDEIEHDRFKWSLLAAKKFRSIVVLKGPYTIITTENGDQFVNTHSSVTLATAGSGDVLAGLIAGYTHSMGTLLATRLAVYIHGLVGEHLEKLRGTDAVMANDILSTVPEIIYTYSKDQ